MWAVKRLRTSLQSSKQSTVVLTDHSATKQVVEKTSLETSSTDRANRRLVVASIYLSEYDLEVFHLPGKKNFIPDALSGMTAPETDVNPRRLRPDYTALDDMLMVSKALMADDTKARFQQGYVTDTKFSKMITIILGKEFTTASQLISEDAGDTFKAGIPFVLRDGLFYHQGVDSHTRFCVPHAMKEEILKTAHNNQHHFGIERIMKELLGLYIHNLTHAIKKHIHSCQTCCLGQTDRQPRIGSYQAIRPPVNPMHTIAIDFVVSLPPRPSADSP